MHRQLSLFASPKQQQYQQPPDGTGTGTGGDAAQAMAAAEDESSASHSHSNSKASRGWWSATARGERAIHLIPLLTFLCFLLLFLCSHDPSPADMSSFAGGAAGGSVGGVARSGNRRLRML